MCVCVLAVSCPLQQATMQSKTIAEEGAGESESVEGLFRMVPPASAAAESLAVLRSMQQEGQLCDV